MSNEMIEAFWRFVYDRQMIHHRRAANLPQPWTGDPILANHRFTNVYRVDDRVSQYLVRNVLYNEPWDAHNLIFRSILFRIFNQPATWEALRAGLEAEPTLSNFDPDVYADMLTAHRARGHTVFNNAYMMCGVQIYSDREKHRNWLYLLRHMMQEQVPTLVLNARSLHQVFSILRQFQLVGDFLAMQWAIDINYSTATNHDENEFIVAGPGAIRGVAKLGSRDPGLMIRRLTEQQEDWFRVLDIRFPWLGGTRRLHLIDVQNCLCEFDKYARMMFPERVVGPTFIKQRFNPRAAQDHEPIIPFYPPKWSIV